MNEPTRSAFQVWLEDGWQDVPGISHIAVDAYHSPMPRELITAREPEPTPIERALDILRPHLAHEPLYQPKEH
ncbi:hypothetical protein ACFV0C_36925 [Streptomyces sp. NPDC059568]|uniref:hypothetical protein n=1 Tax=Streptomyces sp. NPDC059568 TaxID=3346868 RepID=UPI00369BE491